MFNEIEFKIALGRIEKYLTSRGYSVQYDSNSYYIDEDNIIHAPKQYKHTTLKTLCALLHEAGHTQQPDSILLTGSKTVKRNQAVVIEQEYLAWSKGLDIGYELNIMTDELRTLYIQEWIRHWTSYINLGFDPCFNQLAEPYITQFKGTQELIQGYFVNRSRVKQLKSRVDNNVIKGNRPINLG